MPAASKSLRFFPVFASSAGLLLLLTTPGCGKEVVRGADDPSVDSHAVSTGLDKEDIKRALRDTLNKLRAAPVMNEWRTSNPKSVVAVFPFQNSTSEHIDSALDTVLSEAETWLLESQVVRIIDRRRQADFIRDVEGQQHPVFNPANAAKYGKQMGAKYYVTGHVSGNDERNEDMRRVQYFLYLEVVNVETSEKLFLAKSEITKAVR
jgi:penicillin-binding protein activator